MRKKKRTNSNLSIKGSQKEKKNEWKNEKIQIEFVSFTSCPYPLKNSWILCICYFALSTNGFFTECECIHTYVHTGRIVMHIRAKRSSISFEVSLQLDFPVALRRISVDERVSKSSELEKKI